MKQLFTILGLFLIASCYVPPPPTVVGTLKGAVDTFTFIEPYDQVWTALIMSLSEKGWPFNVVDKESGLISTEMIYAENLYMDWQRIAYRRLRSGKHEGIFWYSRGRYLVNIIARAVEGGGTKIKFTIRFEATSDNLTIWIPWQSTGALEEEIVERIEAILTE